MATADRDQPGIWIETFLASLAGRVERCLDDVERRVDGMTRPATSPGPAGLTDDDDAENPIRNWRWE